MSSNKNPHRPPVEKTVKTSLTKTSDTERKVVEVNDFSIADIPNVMDKLGWKEGARLMRHWFTGAPYEMSLAYKIGTKDDRDLKKSGHTLENIDFNWLSTSSTRTKKIVASLIIDFSGEHREYGQRIGRTQNTLDQLSKGLIEFMHKLEILGLLSREKQQLTLSNCNYSAKAAIELDHISQFNREIIGASLWEKGTDAFDDVYAALGAFNIKMAATKFSTAYDVETGFSKIHITEIGIYIRDSYDFLGSEQLLGYWSQHGLLKPSAWQYSISKPDAIDSDNKRYFKVTNASFNEYRKNFNKGGDFAVYSTVKLIPTDIDIHLSAIDFEEYIERIKHQ